MHSSKFTLSSIAALGIFAAICFLMASPVAAAQTEKVLYSFHGGNDGGNPSTSLVADAAGNLFGTTSHGGSPACTDGCGTVYELTPRPRGQWAKSVIYSFQGGKDGNAPIASLIFDAAGNLYGTTVKGGVSN